MNGMAGSLCRLFHRRLPTAVLSALVRSLLLMLIAAGSAHAAISFVYPSPKGVVSRSDYLIMKLNNPEISAVKLTVNGAEGELLKTGTPEYRKAFRDFLILQAFWDAGKNSVLVDAYSGDKKIESAALEFFYRAKRDGEAAPATYDAVPFHSAENERLCSPCHNMTPPTAQTEQSLGKGNPCYVCHYKMINVTYVHGPAGTFSCTYCHSGRQGAKYSATRQDATLCAECHVELVADFNKRKFRHGPVDAGMCEICHDLHGSGNVFQLRAPINELCLSCHEKVAQSPHVMRSSSGKGHPLEGVPDPSQPGTGRMLSCASCHNPHAGDVRYYFRKNPATTMDLCQMCHMK